MIKLSTENLQILALLVGLASLLYYAFALISMNEVVSPFSLKQVTEHTRVNYSHETPVLQGPSIHSTNGISYSLMISKEEIQQAKEITLTITASKIDVDANYNITVDGIPMNIQEKKFGSSCNMYKGCKGYVTFHIALSLHELINIDNKMILQLQRSTLPLSRDELMIPKEYIHGFLKKMKEHHYDN